MSIIPRRVLKRWNTQSILTKLATGGLIYSPSATARAVQQERDRIALGLEIKSAEYYAWARRSMDVGEYPTRELPGHTLALAVRAIRNNTLPIREDGTK